MLTFSIKKSWLDLIVHSANIDLLFFQPLIYLKINIFLLEEKLASRLNSFSLYSSASPVFRLLLIYIFLSLWIPPHLCFPTSHLPPGQWRWTYTTGTEMGGKVFSIKFLIGSFFIFPWFTTTNLSKSDLRLGVLHLDFSCCLMMISWCLMFKSEIFRQKKDRLSSASSSRVSLGFLQQHCASSFCFGRGSNSFKWVCGCSLPQCTGFVGYCIRLEKMKHIMKWW